GVAVTTNPFFITDGLGDRLSDGDTDILSRVVVINMRIPIAGDVQVDHAVARDLIHHVLKKGHASVKHALASAIKIEANADFSFEGITGNLGDTIGHTWLQWAAHQT